MQKRLIVIFTTILFLLALVVSGELYWLKKPEKQKAEKANNAGTIKNSTACEFEGKTYQPAELFFNPAEQWLQPLPLRRRRPAGLRKDLLS